jgi:hypothetical protein
MESQGDATVLYHLRRHLANLESIAIAHIHAGA